MYTYAESGYPECDFSDLSGDDISTFHSLDDVYSYSRAWHKVEKCYNEQYKQDSLIGLIENLQTGHSCTPKVYRVFEDTDLISESRWRSLISACDRYIVKRQELLLTKLLEQVLLYAKANNTDVQHLIQEQEAWSKYFEGSCVREVAWGVYKISAQCQMSVLKARILNVANYHANNNIYELNDLITEYSHLLDEQG